MYAGLVTAVVELSFSIFGKLRAKFEAILGFVGICILLTLCASNDCALCGDG